MSTPPTSMPPLPAGAPASLAEGPRVEGAFTVLRLRLDPGILAQLAAGFRALRLEYVPSVANFLLVKVGDGLKVFEALQRRGVIVRPVKSYGLPEWVRITVGTKAQNERVLAELKAVL